MVSVRFGPVFEHHFPLVGGAGQVLEPLQLVDAGSFPLGRTLAQFGGGDELLPRPDPHDGPIVAFFGGRALQLGQLAPGHGKAEERVSLHHVEEMGEVPTHLLVDRAHHTHLVQRTGPECAATIRSVYLENKSYINKKNNNNKKYIYKKIGIKKL